MYPCSRKSDSVAMYGLSAVNESVSMLRLEDADSVIADCGAPSTPVIPVSHRPRSFPTVPAISGEVDGGAVVDAAEVVRVDAGAERKVEELIGVAPPEAPQAVSRQNASARGVRPSRWSCTFWGGGSWPRPVRIPGVAEDQTSRTHLAGTLRVDADRHSEESDTSLEGPVAGTFVTSNSELPDALRPAQSTSRNLIECGPRTRSILQSP